MRTSSLWTTSPGPGTRRQARSTRSAVGDAPGPTGRRPSTRSRLADSPISCRHRNSTQLHPVRVFPQDLLRRKVGLSEDPRWVELDTEALLKYFAPEALHGGLPASCPALVGIILDEELPALASRPEVRTEERVREGMHTKVRPTAPQYSEDVELPNERVVGAPHAPAESLVEQGPHLVFRFLIFGCR